MAPDTKIINEIRELLENGGEKIPQKAVSRITLAAMAEIMDKTKDLPEVIKKVEEHERILKGEKPGDDMSSRMINLEKWTKATNGIGITLVIAVLIDLVLRLVAHVY